MPIGFVPSPEVPSQRPLVSAAVQGEFDERGEGKKLIDEVRKALGLKADAPSLGDVAVAKNLVTAIDTFRVNASEIRDLFFDAAKPVLAMEHGKTLVGADRALAALRSAVRRLAGLGELATALVADESGALGDPAGINPPSPMGPPPPIPDIAARAKQLVAEFGRKADGLCGRLAAFDIEFSSVVESYGDKPFGERDRLAAKKEVLGLRGEITSFVRDLLANDGPTGLRVFAKSGVGNDGLPAAS